MASTLTGGILVIGATTVTGVQSCTVGGLEINDINYAANNDSGGVTNHIPGTVTEGPMTATAVYVSAMQSAIRTIAEARTAVAVSFTDGAGTAYKWSGNGFVSSVSGVDSDPDSEDTYTITITPSTKWTYGAA